MTLTELEKLQNVDPVTVDRSSLAEVTDIEIDRSLPKKERIQDYFRQIKNPYCYLQNGIVVKISFTIRYRIKRRSLFPTRRER